MNWGRGVLAHARRPDGDDEAVLPPIEIKINLDAEVPRALSVLECPPEEGRRRSIWFAEARTVDGPALPLFAGHLIIRMRSGDRDDLTVKLRPCSLEDLAPRWRRPFDDRDFSYRVESDWSGSQHVLAASAVSRRPPGSLARAMQSGTDPAEVLDPAQRQFLVTCTPGGVPIDHLVPLGPIVSTTWSGIPLAGHTVDLERWTVDGLDLLEISVQIRASPGESIEAFESRADDERSTLESFFHGHRLQPSVDDTKTRRVLSVLVREHMRPTNRP